MILLLFSLLFDGAPVPPFSFEARRASRRRFRFFSIPRRAAAAGPALVGAYFPFPFLRAKEAAVSKEDAEIERLIDAAGRKPWQ